MMNLKNMLIAVGLGTVMAVSTFAQGTAFTYQGQLNSGTNTATGTYNLMFSLFNTNTGGSAIAGPVTENAVAVNNGLFTTRVDFGPGVFTGATNWLQIAVATNGSVTFTNLTPRQQLTPTPYAIYAESANATNLVGTIPAANLSGAALLNAGNTYTGLNVYNNLIKVVGPVSNNGYFGFLEEDTSDTGDFWILTKWDNVGNKRFSIYDGNGVTPIVFQENGGNVGIGTTTPAQALEVNGNAQIDADVIATGPLAALSFDNRNNSAEAWQWNATSTGASLQNFGGSAGIPLHVAENGNVGIATTTPTTALQVNGAVTATSFAGDGSGLTNVALLNRQNTFAAQQTIKTGAGSYGLVVTDNTNQIGYYIAQGQCSFGTITPHELGFFVNNGFDSMDLNTNGNLGIGTGTPAAKLEVNGNAQIDGTLAANYLRAPGLGINTGTYAFTQRCVATNTATDGTVIFNPVCNGDPNAILIVTHNWTADTNSTSQYNTKPVGVYYTGANWVIFNEDQSAMALGRAFNVMVIKP